MLLDSDLIVNLLENFIALRFGNRFFVWQMLYQWLPCSPLPCSHFESPNCRAHDCCFCSFRSQTWHLFRDRISSLGQRSQAQLDRVKSERRTKLNSLVQSLTGYSWSNTSGLSPQSARKSPFSGHLWLFERKERTNYSEESVSKTINSPSNGFLLFFPNTRFNYVGGNRENQPE
uniref:(northern house mosquito) hypothetical protein n=1 Tax=Culex pipiens TaxID=7175 RepID=A0A8D8FVN8_CULPI